MARIGRILSVSIALASIGLMASAGQNAPPVAPEDDGSVRLYTNADLEKFGPPSPTPAASAAEEGEGWGEVQAFLDREYARIDADRQLDLARTSVGTLAVSPPCGISSPAFLFPGLAGFPTIFLGQRRFPVRRTEHARRAAMTNPFSTPFDPRAFMNRRVTIHEQPPVGSRGRSR